MKRLDIMTIIVLLCAFFTVSAQDNKEVKNEDWKIGGQVQIRGELDGRDFLNTTYPFTFANSRIRLSLEKTVANTVTFYAEIQDSRMFGQTQNTIRNLGNMDLHQGYAKIHNVFNSPITFTVGRFEHFYATQRIFGTNTWNFIARAWDGAKIGYNTKDIKLDVFGLSHSLAYQYIGSALPTRYPVPSAKDTSHAVYGFWLGLPTLVENNTFDIYTYYELNNRQTVADNPDVSRLNFGLYWNLKADALSAMIGGNYQTGKVINSGKIKDVAGYLVEANVGYKVGDLAISANLDMQSGTNFDEQSDKYNNYQSPFGAKHVFNGYMNYFSDIDAATTRAGLNDIFLRVIFQQKGSPFSAQLDAHNFMANAKTNGDLSQFGQEFDIVLKYEVIKNTTVEWGGSIFMSGDLMKRIYQVGAGQGVIVREDPGFWSYLMIRSKI